jgi:hypothetical protein
VTVPFVVQLRSKRPPIELAPKGAGSITFRVEASDIWEAVRVVATPSTFVAEVKERVIATLFPKQHQSQFALKLRGWEILDEGATLSDAEIVNGSIVLIAFRRRRPVR